MNTGQLGRLGYDINITWAWRNGFNGEGIKLSVLDDGVQGSNIDLEDNFVSLKIIFNYIMLY